MGCALETDAHSDDATAAHARDLGRAVGAELDLVADARDATEVVEDDDADRLRGRPRPRRGRRGDGAPPCVARASTSQALLSFGTFTMRAVSSSSSSRISPTISSRRSSIVTMPLVPPYSSTTTAMGICDFCMSRSTSRRLCVSGTKRSSRVDRLERGELRVRGVEEKVLRVEVAGDLVDALLLREHDARVLVRAELVAPPPRPLVPTGSVKTSTRGTIAWRAVRFAKRATRSKRSARPLPPGLRAALAARMPMSSSSESEPSLAASALIPMLRRMSFVALLEDPEQRLEGDVDELERPRGAEGDAARSAGSRRASGRARRRARGRTSGS